MIQRACCAGAAERRTPYNGAGRSVLRRASARAARAGCALLALIAACDARLDGPSPDGGALGNTGGQPPGQPSDPGWSTPSRITAAATAATEDDVTLSSDGLEMIFAVQATTGKDLYYVARKSLESPWGQTAELVPFSAPATSEETPRFSADDKTLYFASDRDTGSLDLYSVTRSARGTNTWATPAPLTALNTARIDKWFAPCAGGRFVMVQGGTGDLFEGVLGGAAPTEITALNSLANDTGPFLTDDCLTIYFASNRSGRSRIYSAHRDSATAAWSDPRALDDFKISGGSGNQEDPWISPDQHTFVFASDAAGTKDIYITTR